MWKISFVQAYSRKHLDTSSNKHSQEYNEQRRWYSNITGLSRGTNACICLHTHWTDVIIINEKEVVYMLTLLRIICLNSLTDCLIMLSFNGSLINKCIKIVQHVQFFILRRRFRGADVWKLVNNHVSYSWTFNEYSLKGYWFKCKVSESHLNICIASQHVGLNIFL